MNNINIQQQKYRVTNIGLLPTDWDVDSLDKVIEPVSRAVSKPLNGYWRLGIRSHAKGTFHEYIEEPEKISMDTLYLVKENDLIVNITFAWEHAIALANKEDDGKLVSHRFPTYVFKSNADPLFYKYYVMQPKFKYELEIISPGGAGRNRVMSKKDFLKIEVCIPPLKEQQKIASILSTWDKAIDLKEKLIEQKKQQKKGLMQKLLTGEVRLPGFEGEWKTKKLKDLCTKIMDGTHATPNYTESGIPFYSVENVTNRDFSNHKYISYEEHLTISSRCKVEKGDILMTRIGSIGDAVLVDWDYESSIYVSLALIKTNEKILSEYLVHYMATDKFKKDILSKSLLSAIPQKINLVDIGRVNIYFPQDIQEQQAIAKILNDAEKEISLLEKELDNVRQQKKGLMQLLLTGKVRVKV